MFSAKGDFGKMAFQHFGGEGFDIWFSSYRISKPVKFYGGTDDPLLEFHCHYTSSFYAGWNGLTQAPMRHRQYQISFAPSIETSGEFPGAKQYDTFDIHFYRPILEPYVNFCPRLGKFLEKVDAGKPANMLDLITFLTPGMEQAIMEIMSYNLFEEWTGSFFTRRVQDLLVHMVYHLGTMDKAPKFDQADIDRAEQVRKIILDDFSVFDSVEILARKVGTAEAKLQLTFKHLYGVTVGKFSKDERMKKAHDLLFFTKEILLSVALSVGYNDAGNFSTAFKNHFGYSPGHVQKRMKK
jgi:AraC-like DNA-binding protein